MKTAPYYILSALALSAVISLAITGLVFGASTMDEQYKASLEAIKVTYETNKASCDNFTGNKKDICQTQAIAMRNNAKADLDAEKGGTRKASMAASKEKVLSSYKIAVEACDDLPSNLQSYCVANAKTNRDQALATIEANVGEFNGGDTNIKVETNN